ncbi:2-alkenal reductase (NADP(+)-dependent)-like [Magnolia sinica]|uniref:2-alkenal reductase (NADP(+)-dependent)-like n=1 Tax=Magnolia sinica TaxID=86752 RepID=UPI00265A50A0|nr:2-alkenal reductase (NADP(+)-dependent)-like [Magnolia sinica]
MEVENKFVTIKGYVDGPPSESDFEVAFAVRVLKADQGSNDVIVKNICVSVDPYQINRMKNYSSSQTTSSFATRLVPGEGIDAYGIGRVVASDNSEFAEGDIVVGLLGWEEYSVVRGGNWLRRINSTEFPFSYHVGILGLSGLTAYSGFYNICKPKKGEKVFVSAATGSVGHVVGQLAKLFGCYVVGCAGSKQKVDVLKDKLGFDDAFNYKDEPDLKSALKRYFPDGIDIYFDNVGGEMLEAAVANMNTFGRVAVCGVISEYIDDGRRVAPDMLDVVYKRITIQGFLASDHMNVMADFISTISDHLRNAKIHALEDISQGLESAPAAFLGLFRGHNVGKKLVRISAD